MDDRGGSGDRDHVPPREAPRRRMRETLLLKGQAKARLDARSLSVCFLCVAVSQPYCVCIQYMYMLEHH